MSILTATPASLKGLAPWSEPGPHEKEKPGLWLREFMDDAGRKAARGRITIWERPRPNRVYTLGFDCAHGIEGRDLSTVCLMDKTCQREGDGRVRQVAEAAGHWGEEVFDRVVYGLVAYYGPRVFVMGEAQGGGLAVMRDLWDHYGHTWMYYDRTVHKMAPRIAANARLGWNTTADDLTLTEFREAVRMRKVELRSVQLLEQMRRFRWTPRSKTAEKDGRLGDDTLKPKLDGGGSPDLIVAARLAWYAVGECQHYDPPKEPLYGPHTYGAIFGHEEYEKKEDDGDDQFAPGRRHVEED